MMRPALALFAAVLAVLSACDKPQNDRYQGYVEGEYVDVAPPVSGRLEKLHVARGQWVEKEALLFTLEASPEREAVDEAAARLKEAEHRLQDAEQGARPSEIATYEARIHEAEAALSLAEIRLARIRRLSEQQFASKQQLDEAGAEKQAAQARLAALHAELATARLGARDEAIAALGKAVTAAKAKLTAAEWQLRQKQRLAPQAARVTDTFYRVGEFVPSNRPVLRLLPPANVILRFFVPEVDVAKLQPGQKLLFSCDGCPEAMVAHIRFIASDAEFTPPVIFSREARAKLVFLVEVKPAPEVANKLNPGQPVDVWLAP